MRDAMMDARAEAICEVSSAILKAAGGTLERHGNDPMAKVILSAAFSMAISSIDRSIDPGFQKIMHAMLAPKGSNA